jgi:CBS domain-containing protein
MRVSDVMSRDVITIEPSRSCRDAASRMCGARIRHLPVVDRDGSLVGVVTDRDLRHRLFQPGVFREVGMVAVDVLLSDVPVSAVMSTPAIAIEAGADLEDAARLMLEDKVGSLPVVDHGRVVGILTETDLLRRIVDADERCRTEVECIVVSYP